MVKQAGLVDVLCCVIYRDEPREAYSRNLDSFFLTMAVKDRANLNSEGIIAVRAFWF